MIPNTFEAATLTGRLGPVGYNVGYLTAMKPRQEDDFQNMAEVAGVQGRNRGLVLTRLSSEPLPGLSLYGANYLVPDVFNTAFGNADYTRALADDLAFRIGIQYTDQRSTGSEFLGEFQTWNFGIRGLILWRGLTTGAAFNVTGDDASLRTPYGSWPGYLAFMETDFNRADEKAWGVGVRYDFGPGPCSRVSRFPGSRCSCATPRGTTGSTRRPAAGSPPPVRGTSTSSGTSPGSRGSSSGSATPSPIGASASCSRRIGSS